VQAVIGDHGQKLEGPLVKKGALGKYIVYKTRYEVGGAVSKEKDTASKQEYKKQLREQMEKFCHELCVTKQVQTGNLTNFDWDGCYNNCIRKN
jgi:hypothetical protein